MDNKQTVFTAVVCKDFGDREYTLTGDEHIEVRINAQRMARFITVGEMADEFPDDRWNFRLCEIDYRGVSNGGLSGPFADLIKSAQFTSWFFSHRSEFRDLHNRRFWLEAFPWTEKMAQEQRAKWAADDLRYKENARVRHNEYVSYMQSIGTWG